jgi:hypothetical protein
MAIVQLKEVTVTRLNNTGNGVKVTESNESGGKTYTKQFTCWFDEPSGLIEGDIVSLSGFLGAKVGDPWTGDDGQERRSVELSINKPRIDTGASSNATSNATNEEPWTKTAPVQTDVETNGFSFEGAAPF